MHERCRVTRGGLDRDGLSAGRHGAREADDAVDGGEHVRSGCRSEVDTAVLAGGIRVRMVKGKRTQDGPVHRPRPRARRDRKSKRAQRDNTETPKHETSFVVRFENWTTVARPLVCCQYWLQSTAVELVARRAGESRDDVGRPAPWHPGRDEL